MFGLQRKQEGSRMLMGNLYCFCRPPGAPATGGSHFYNRKICSMKWKIFLLKYFPLHNPNIKLYGIHEKVAGKCYTLISLRDRVAACRQCQQLRLVLFRGNVPAHIQDAFALFYIDYLHALYVFTCCFCLFIVTTDKTGKSSNRSYLSSCLYLLE